MPKIFSSWIFWFLSGHLLAWFFLLWQNRKYFWQQFKEVDKRVLYILLLIFLYGFIMRNSGYWLGPTTDAYVYSESAFFWTEEGKITKSCALGNHANCQLFEDVLFPPGFPLIISYSNLIFGPHSLNASVISATLSSLVILLVFLISRLLFKNEAISLYASLVYSLLPLNIIYSATGFSRLSGLFFASISLFLYLLAGEKNKRENWLALVLSLSFAIYIRPENYVLAVLFLAHYLFTERKEIHKKIKQILLLIGLFIFWQLPLLIVYNPFHSLGFLFARNFGEPFNAPASINWITEGFLYFRHFLNDWGLIFHYNIIASVAAVVALIFVIIKKRKYSLVVFLFFGYLLVFCLANDANTAGADNLTQSYFRRSLLLHLPYSLLAGYGLFLFWPKVAKIKIFNIAFIVFLLVALNPVFLNTVRISNRDVRIEKGAEIYWLNKNSSFYLPGNIFEESADDKNRYNFIINPDQDYWPVLEKLPENCMILTSSHLLPQSDFFKNKKFKVASLDLINSNNENLFLQEFKKQECLYYLEDIDKIVERDYLEIFFESYFNKAYEFQIGEVSVYQLRLK